MGAALLWIDRRQLAFGFVASETIGRESWSPQLRRATRIKELALTRSGNNPSPRKTLLTLLIGNS